MKCQLSIQEKLKDLKVEKGLCRQSGGNADPEPEQFCRVDAK